MFDKGKGIKVKPDYTFAIALSDDTGKDETKEILSVSRMCMRPPKAEEIETRQLVSLLVSVFLFEATFTSLMARGSSLKGSDK